MERIRLSDSKSYTADTVLPLAGRTISRMIASDLLQILVCPACKSALEYRQAPESLKCTSCHRVYEVKDDIPNMLVDEARIEE